ncbi:MAG: hypothetical protein IAF38_05440, partial [Bacteroidia bacterium]|nr:hypothetical protein [Bacteroidia bacterium]
MVTLISAYNFNAVVLNAIEPVLIHFWSFLSPSQDPTLMQELGVEYAGRAIIGKMDAGAIDNFNICGTYAVDSVPTFLIFKGGQV